MRERATPSTHETPRPRTQQQPEERHRQRQGRIAEKQAKALQKMDYKIETHIERISGDVASWQRMNRKFLNVLRKRFLVWRTLSPVIRQGYQDEVEKAFAGAGQQAV